MRGGFYSVRLIAERELDGPTRTAYRALGYGCSDRRIFVQPMGRIPRPPAMF